MPFSIFFPEFESVLDNQFKIQKPQGPLNSVFPRPLARGSSMPLGMPGAHRITPYSPVARHHGFKASPVPAPLSNAREATASPASLLSPSVLLHHATTSSSTPPPVSRAWVDWRFSLASPHHRLPHLRRKSPPGAVPMPGGRVTSAAEVQTSEPSRVMRSVSI
jgi:hypothetical protein